MAVLFLDVDGVLATSKQLLDLDEQGLVALDVGCVRRLARLVAMSKAQVVVSSTWGKDPALYEHLLSSLQRLGGDALRNAVVDVTPRGSLGRGFEILQWLEA
ncbi:unnamed protein product, partial [Effrenium voratum]